MSITDDIGDYPGRGLIHHIDPDGTVGWIYFVTGRSDASRSRRLRQERESLFVEPITGDPDDHLRHYACARVVNEHLIIGNGDHVDMLAERIADLATAVATIEPEPDPPIWTPRIALALGEDPRAIAVSGPPGHIERRNTPLALAPGQATLLTTYAGDRDKPEGRAPISNRPEPRVNAVLADAVWAHLPVDLRVLLVNGTGNNFLGCAVRHED